MSILQKQDTSPPVKKLRTDTDTVDSSQNTNMLIQDIGELDLDQLDSVTSPVSKIDTPKPIPKSKFAVSKYRKLITIVTGLVDEIYISEVTYSPSNPVEEFFLQVTLLLLVLVCLYKRIF